MPRSGDDDQLEETFYPERPPTPDLTVDWSEPEPIGELLSANGEETLMWIYPPRIPFGFTL